MPVYMNNAPKLSNEMSDNDILKSLLRLKEWIDYWNPTYMTGENKDAPEPYKELCFSINSLMNRVLDDK